MLLQDKNEKNDNKANLRKIYPTREPDKTKLPGNSSNEWNQ